MTPTPGRIVFFHFRNRDDLLISRPAIITDVTHRMHDLPTANLPSLEKK